MKRCIQQSFILGIFFGCIYTQVFSDYLYVGHEALASAGSVVASKGGESSLFHNPSGLAEVDNFQVNSGYGNLYNLSFLPYTSLGLIIPSKYGKFGMSFQGLSVNYLGNKLITEKALGFSQGVYFQNDRNSSLSLGYTVNYLSIDQGTTVSGNKLGSAATIGLDLGILATYRKRHRVGAFVKNINNPTFEEVPMPRRLNIGIAYSPYVGVMTSFTTSRLLGSSSTQYMSGLIYKLNHILSLSTGFQSNPNRMGAGFQIHAMKINFGYGLLTHHVLPITHQFSLGWAVE